MPELELDTVFEAEENRLSSDGESSENSNFKSNGTKVGLAAKRPSGPSLVLPSLAEAKITMKMKEEAIWQEAELSSDYSSKCGEEGCNQKGCHGYLQGQGLIDADEIVTCNVYQI